MGILVVLTLVFSGWLWPAVSGVHAEEIEGGLPNGLGKSAGAAEILPLHEVRPGMKGIGKTVIRGTQIEEFEVEVLGLLAGQETAHHLILVQVGGEIIEQAGGIASGMSGSPVYINRRLMGAISYTFDLTDHSIGMVTPIGPMLELIRLNRDVSALSRPMGVWKWVKGAGGNGLLLAGRPIETVTISQAQGVNTEFSYNDGHLEIQPAATPIFVGGMNERAQKRLAAAFEPFGMRIVGGLGAASGAVNDSSQPGPAIEPGSAFSVELIRGDTGVMALGTVTYKDGNYFLGFGHPFLNKGTVDLFASNAYIYTTVNNISMPFKLGVALDTVGSLVQDRGAGVVGQLGRAPKTLDLKVKVVDKDLGTTKEFKAQIVNEPNLIVSLVSAAALQGLDVGIDRLGSGTARVVYQISSQELSQPVVRDNMFYSPLDISAVSLAETLETLHLLNDNEFQAIDIEAIEINAQVEAARRTAFIEKAVPAVAEAFPGEVVDVEVVIRPYRGQRETKILKLAIPEGAERGVIHVTVRSGGMGYYLAELTPFHDSEARQEGTKSDLESAMEPLTDADSLDKLLETILGREKHHEIVMEYIPYYDTYMLEPLPTVQSKEAEFMNGDVQGDFGHENDNINDDNGNQSKTSKSGMWNNNGTKPVRVTLPTRYVIEGQTNFEITVKSKDELDDAADIESETRPSPAKEAVDVTIFDDLFDEPIHEGGFRFW